MLLCPPSEENMKREPSPLTSDFHSGSTVTSPPLTDIRKNDASSLQPVSTVCIPPCLRRKPPCSHHRLVFGASKSKALPSPTGQDTKARNLEPSLTPFFHHFAPPSKPSVPLVLPTFTPSPATSFLSAQPSMTWEAARAFPLVSLLLPSILSVHFLQRSQRHSLKKRKRSKG